MPESPQNSTMDDIRRAFEHFDLNNNNSISKEELSLHIKSFSPSAISDEDVEKVIQLVDVNADGSIDVKVRHTLFTFYATSPFHVYAMAK